MRVWWKHMLYTRLCYCSTITGTSCWHRPKDKQKQSLTGEMAGEYWFCQTHNNDILMFECQPFKPIEVRFRLSNSNPHCVTFLTFLLRSIARRLYLHLSHSANQFISKADPWPDPGTLSSSSTIALAFSTAQVTGEGKPNLIGRSLSLGCNLWRCLLHWAQGSGHSVNCNPPEPRHAQWAEVELSRAEM